MAQTHLPPWAKPGCKVLLKWAEPISSGTAEGVRSRVKYLDTKGKEKVMTMWITWNE